MNSIEEKLFQEIKIIQEEVVLSSLGDNSDIKDSLFDVTHDIVFKIFELFDGYGNTDLKLDIVDKESRNSINIHRNLHDLCSKYLHSGNN